MSRQVVIRWVSPSVVSVTSHKEEKCLSFKLTQGLSDTVKKGELFPTLPLNWPMKVTVTDLGVAGVAGDERAAQVPSRVNLEERD